MIGDFRVVAVIPAGRKRYLDILMPYLLDQKGLIDELHLWENTTDAEDLEYLYELTDQQPEFIRIISLDDTRPNLSGVKRVKLIRHFFRHCTDPKTVYIRFDDDICWIEPEAIKTLLEFRLQNPDYFLVYPAVINSGRTAYIHQVMGHLPESLPLKFSEASLIQSHFSLGEVIHQHFFEALAASELENLKFGKYIISDYEKVPINCICWFGKDFLEFGGIVADDPESKEQEEYWLTKIKPKQLNRPNCICGEAIMAHFAFHTQREHMESNTGFLELYRALVHDRQTLDYSWLRDAI